MAEEVCAMIFMSMTYNIALVPYTREFLEKSWNWLHDDYIKYYTDTPDFTLESQEAWFNRIMTDNQHLVYGLRGGGGGGGVNPLL